MPNVLSPRDLVFRPDNMDKTVLHTQLAVLSTWPWGSLCHMTLKVQTDDPGKQCRSISGSLLFPILSIISFERRHEKTCIPGFPPGPIHIRLYNHRGWLEVGNFRLRKKRDCTMIENKGTDELHGYCAAELLFYRAADLRLCLRICKISHDAAQLLE